MSRHNVKLLNIFLLSFLVVRLLSPSVAQGSIKEKTVVFSSSSGHNHNGTNKGRKISSDDVTHSPSGGVSATDVEGALNELDDEKLSNSDLPYINVADYGATGDGSTDDLTAINAAVSATATGGVLFFPRPTNFYRITGEIPISKSMEIRGVKSRIDQETAGETIFELTASGVSINGMILVGPQFVTYVEGERAINAEGSDKDNFYSNIKVFNNEMSSWGGYGVRFEFVESFSIANNYIHDMARAGILMVSARRGEITHNIIEDVTGIAPAYGIVLSRQPEVSIINYPKPEEIVISSNVVHNVTNWEGIDLHAGHNITITGNVVTACYAGISVTSANAGAVLTFASTNISVTGNTVNSGVSDGSYGIGIQFAGAADGVPALVEYSTGSITGNTIIGHGVATTTTSGGISIQATKGVTVSGNTVVDCSPTAIHVRYLNRGFNAVGNAIIDPWSNSVDGIAFFVDDGDNEGYIGNNTFVLAEKSASQVLTRGIQVTDLSTNNIVIGNNKSEASIYISDTGQRTLRGLQGIVVSTSGTGEDDLQSMTIPADSLTQGRVLRIKAGGVITNANDTKIIRFKFGSSSTEVHPADNLPNAARWSFEGTMEISTNTAQRMLWKCTSETGGSVNVHQGYSTFSETMTNDNIIKFTGECANANDIVYQLFWFIEII
jgi:hypothetical protein